MNEPITYALPQDLLQATVSLLAGLPAAQSRSLLNALEQTCMQQDQERVAKAHEAAMAAAKAEWEKAAEEAAEKAAKEAAPLEPTPATAVAVPV